VVEAVLERRVAMQLLSKLVQVVATALHLQFLVLLLHTLVVVVARQMAILHRLVLVELAAAVRVKQLLLGMEMLVLAQQTQAVVVADIHQHKPLLFLEILVLVVLA
jgi:hypothetical protein